MSARHNVEKNIRNEIIGLATMGCAVLAFASLLAEGTSGMKSSHGGNIGNATVGTLGGLFAELQRALVGWLGAWVMPLLILLIGIHIILGRSTPRLSRRGWGCIIAYMSSLGLIHLLNPNYLLPDQAHPDMWRTIGVAVGGNGGGLVGAILSVVLANLFGVSGSYIVYAVFLIISVFLMVDISVADAFTSICSAAAQTVTAAFQKIKVRATDKKELPSNELGDIDERESPKNKRVRKKKDVDDDSKELTRISEPVVRPDEETTDADIDDEATTLNDKNESEYDAKPEPPHISPPKAVSEGKEVKASPGLAASGVAIAGYQLPPLDLLMKPAPKPGTTKKVIDQSTELVRALEDFGIEASVTGMDRGPHVTRYDIRLAPGIKYNRVANLEDDIALALAAYDVRISPIHGTGNIGVEVANKEVSMVHLREVFESDEFQKNSSKLVIGMGKDIAGIPVVVDLAKMVHTLISGATGSGKSVCVNTLVTSILYRARPEEVKLLMIDPKVVELSVYNDVPHLLAPVITDPKQAASSLKWVVVEMERRYKLFAKASVRHLDSFNQLWATKEETRVMAADIGYGDMPIPYIVVIVDELADLMMVASDDVEDAICRLAQKARAAGIHLVLATQRPSTDVITGLIKANIPSRIAFAVSSSVDSRVILDSNGAERLLGKGDMLCLPMGANKPRRVQGAFISDREVERIVEYVKLQAAPTYREDVFDAQLDVDDSRQDDGGDGDELLKDAVRIVLDTQHASASMLQRKLSIGYSRAARIIDIMEQKGMVGPHQGSKPREILINSKHLEELGNL